MVHQVGTPAAQKALRFMRESQCFVSLDFENDSETSERAPDDLKREYVLPDGKEVAMVGERFRVPELLFRPDAIGHFDGKEGHGLSSKIVKAVYGCAEAIQVSIAFRCTVQAAVACVFASRSVGRCECVRVHYLSGFQGHDQIIFVSDVCTPHCRPR